MSTTTERTTVRHRVGTCPACRVGLWADVDIVSVVGTPFLSEDGKPLVNVTPRAVGMRIEHHCEQDEDA